MLAARSSALAIALRHRPRGRVRVCLHEGWSLPLKFKANSSEPHGLPFLDHGRLNAPVVHVGAVLTTKVRHTDLRTADDNLGVPPRHRQIVDDQLTVR